MSKSISLENLLGDSESLLSSKISGRGPEGELPITGEILREAPSGNLFGMTQNVGMGWDPTEVGKPQFLILSTQGGTRAENGQPIALGYHTGHWEIGLLVQETARTFQAHGGIPFSVTVSDPCDGRTQGTTGMFDSLPYRNDAAITMRRLIRSLPTRQGVMGIATCDKGLPATMLALAGTSQLPGIVVPGGVTLPAADAEDAGAVQTIGVRFVHNLISLKYAAEMGCKACGSTGGGCQFLGTAASSQVVAEALGLSLPHSALAPSGEPVWFDIARRSALALVNLVENRIPLSKILTNEAVENAMLVHAAFGGSTNMLLHLPAIAHAAGLSIPSVDDWNRVNKTTPRLVDALPNGPRNHPTVQVFMAGGVPEVMLHLRERGLLNTEVLTVTGETLDKLLDWWETSPQRKVAKTMLAEKAGVDANQVIFSPDRASKAGLTSTVVFPTGNIAPEGSVVKATAIDPYLIDDDGVYRHTGPARVFTSEREAIRSIKGLSDNPVQPGDVLVLIGGGPQGTGMEETAQVTFALKFLPWGSQVPVLTDARFSGVSTGPCIGHIGPEALDGGPIGKLRNGDQLEILIDRQNLTGQINMVGTANGRKLTAHDADTLLEERDPHIALKQHPDLPDDTKLWAALQRASGGAWRGSIYDVDRIIEVINAGLEALTTD